MDQLHLEKSLKMILQPILAFREREIERLCTVICAILLAGSSQYSLLARQIGKSISQPHRIQFLRRFFDSNLFTQESVYHPILVHALKGYRPLIWHLVIDRTTLKPHELDLLTVAIVFRKRAIILGWQFVNFGMTSASTQIALLERIYHLVPEEQSVILHGDSEFGSVPMMKYLKRKRKWDFILGQSPHTYYFNGDNQLFYLKDLKIQKHRTVICKNILWTKQHRYGPVNLFAFYGPHQSTASTSRVDYRYCLTNLPKGCTYKFIGRRRWGTECMYKDFKSAGFNYDLSAIKERNRLEVLLIVISVAYLWVTCIGRSMTKQGLRHFVDNKKKTLQLFPHWVGSNDPHESLGQKISAQAHAL